MTTTLFPPHYYPKKTKCVFCRENHPVGDMIKNEYGAGFLCRGCSEEGKSKDLIPLVIHKNPRSLSGTQDEDAIVI